MGHRQAGVAVGDVSGSKLSSRMPRPLKAGVCREDWGGKRGSGRDRPLARAIDRRRPDAGETGCGSLAGSAPAECDFHRFLQYCLRNEAIRHFGSSAVPQFEVTMIVSEQLDRFFTEKMREYPTQRSFLVPMLLYTQDELGFLSDEAIAYLAQKVNLNELEIR